jgi:hypothetical protein
MANRYATLADVEARYGIDFSDNPELYPSDAEIYHATNDCLSARAADMIDQYAGVSFTTGGRDVTQDNVCEAACQLIMRMLQERNIIRGLGGLTTIADEWGSMAYTQGEFELLTPEIRLLVDKDRAANAFPMRLTTG